MRYGDNSTVHGVGFRSWILSGVTAASVLLAACGGTSTASGGAAAPATATATAAATEAPTAVATVAPTAVATATVAATAGTASQAVVLQTTLSGAPVPLLVYSAQGYDSDMTKAFQKATGIPTKLVDDSTGPLLAKIQAEKNNPQWGLVWVDGDEAFAAMDGQGMLLKSFTPAVSWTDLGKSVLPKDGSYIPTGVTMAGTMVYDTRYVKTPPAKWQDLLKPEWKGQVGMNNPAISGPTYPFVAGMMEYLGGEPQGKQFFTALKANGLHVYKTNGDTLHALEAGQIKVAMIQSSAGIGADLKVPTVKTTFLPKVSTLPSVIGIDGKAPAQEQTEAKMFAEFVLSQQGQQVMLNGDKSGDSLFWPIISGVQPLSALPSISSVPSQIVDPYLWGPKESEINQWFSTNIAQ